MTTADRFQAFLAEHPEYRGTAVLDALRRTEYRRLDEGGHTYLDFTGGNLYAERQVREHMELLLGGTFGNPHSTNPTSRAATALIEETRAHILRYFGGGDEYLCVFTPNASGALKIVGEAYPFGPESFLLLSLDNHNSVNGIREFAKRRGSAWGFTALDPSTLRLDEGALLRHLDAHADRRAKLFAYPAQSNVSGVKHPLSYVAEARARGWDVLLDTAAFVPSNPLNLCEVKPDFAVVSFYKIFGYPTGLGCLLLRKDRFDTLQKPWYAGGTLSLAAASYDAHLLVRNHERFEDGTLNYLGIPALSIGLRHIESIGIDDIHTRVHSLTAWLMARLGELRHSTGVPLVRIYGTPNIAERGGTLVMDLQDPTGAAWPFMAVEEEANARRISLRTGCFCNPGLDETTHAITQADLERYFKSCKSGDFMEMIGFLGKLRGAIRVSLGLASNFADVDTFYRFAQGFVDRPIVEAAPRCLLELEALSKTPST